MSAFEQAMLAVLEGSSLEFTQALLSLLATKITAKTAAAATVVKSS